MKTILAAAVGVALSTGTAQAAAVFAFEETGGDVVGTLSGALDVSAAGPSSVVSNVALIIPNSADLSTTGSQDAYSVSGPETFGPGGRTDGIGEGDAFFITALFEPITIGVPAGYASGTPLSATLIFEGATFASLGIIPGDYVYALPSQDTLTVRFDRTSVIPLPAGLPLLLAGVGLLALARRR